MLICPTITALDKPSFDKQYLKIKAFADRIHLDLMDGIFTPDKSLDINLINNMAVDFDVHLMFQDPGLVLDQVLSLGPKTVILHQESNFDPESLTNKLHQVGVKASLAILQNTSISLAHSNLDYFDQVLIFSGNLGYHGGSADLNLLSKIKEIKEIKNDLEIAWDGGIQAENIENLKQAGVEVFNVGGYIQDSANALEAYQELVKALEED